MIFLFWNNWKNYLKISLVIFFLKINAFKKVLLELNVKYFDGHSIDLNYCISTKYDFRVLIVIILLSLCAFDFDTLARMLVFDD